MAIAIFANNFFIWSSCIPWQFGTKFLVVPSFLVRTYRLYLHIFSGFGWTHSDFITIHVTGMNLGNSNQRDSWMNMVRFIAPDHPNKTRWNFHYESNVASNFMHQNLVHKLFAVVCSEISVVNCGQQRDWLSWPNFSVLSCGSCWNLAEHK